MSLKKRGVLNSEQGKPGFLDYRRILDEASDLIQMVDPKGKFTYTNKKWRSVLGFSKSEIAKLKFTDILRKDKLAYCRGIFNEIKNGNPKDDIEIVFVSKKGKEIIVEGNFQPSSLNGKFALTIGCFRDVTTQKKSESLLKKLSTAVQQTSDSIVITDVEGIIEYINPACEKVTGFSRKGVMGKKPNVFKSGKHPLAFYRDLWKSLLADRVYHGTIINKKKDGTLFHELKTITPLTDEQGKITHFVSIGKDVTQQKAAEAEKENLIALYTQQSKERMEINEQLQQKISDLELFKKVTVDRELKMADLKEENKILRKQLKQPK